MEKRPKYRVLLVDDDPMVMTTVGRILESLEFEVDSASNGDEAVQRLQQNRFLAVCTDLEMPGMGGIELIRQVRTRSPATAMILMTGRDHHKHVLSAGADSYLKKPFDADELLDAVEKALQKRKAAGEEERGTDRDAGRDR